MKKNYNYILTKKNLMKIIKKKKNITAEQT